MHAGRTKLVAIASRLAHRAKSALRQMTLIEFDDFTDSGAIRAQQLKEIVSLTPWMMLGAVINCVIIISTFGWSHDTIALNLWGAALIGTAGLTVTRWNAGRHRADRPTASKRAAVRAIRHAALLGALWGILPFIISGLGSESDRILVTILIVGMSASGAFALAVLPAAAVAHLIAMIAPLLVAMAAGYAPSSPALAILLVNYFVILALIILARYREFKHRIRDQHSLERQRQTIAVLLKDFESSASDWLWETDAEGRLTYVAGRLCDVSGLTKDALSGRPISVAGGDAGRHTKWTELLQSIRKGLSIRELEVPVSRGTQHGWWSLSASPITAADGAITGYRGVGADISERKAAQTLIEERNAALVSFNVRLETEVAKRTEEARKAATEAAEANRAKSGFLANMSHEIRTPMNGVLGMTDLLSRTALDDRQHRLLNTISQSAKSLLTIINDVLDVSRIEAGKLAIERAEFDLQAALEDTVDLLAETAARKGLQLTLFIGAGVPRFVTGDVARLRQVCMNLVSNAVKFTTAGEVSLTVSRRDLTGETPHIEFQIRDTGIGIPPGVQERLFRPFEQADTSIARRFGGTGLGLAISKHLVQMMGGGIQLISEPDKGSIFTYWLPLETARTSAPDDSAVLAGHRILVCDGNVTGNHIISSYLRHAGGEVISVDTPSAAISALTVARATNRAITLAIFSLDPQSSEGVEAIRAIRTDEHHTNLVTILAAPMTWKGGTDAAKSLGFSAVLTRPIRRGALVAAAAECAGVSYSALSVAKIAGPMPPLPASPLTDACNVLVAEDNPVNIEVVREYLKSFGCACTIAENGFEVLAAFSEERFDIILMDCQMPGMDGLEATRRIRAKELASGAIRTPIVALTANAYDEDRRRCHDAGMDAFLSKPFTEDQLRAALELRSKPHPSQHAA